MYAMSQLPMFTEYRKIHIVVIATKHKQSCNVTKLLWKGLSTMYTMFNCLCSVLTMWLVHKKILICQFLKSKMADRSKMARNAIQSEFRTSKMTEGSHFVQKNPKKNKVAYRSEMARNASDLNNVRTDCWLTTTWYQYICSVSKLTGNKWRLTLVQFNGLFNNPSTYTTHIPQSIGRESIPMRMHLSHS